MTKLLKNIFVNLFILIFFFLASPQYATAKIDDSGFNDSIKVVLDDNYPPYVFRDRNGDLQGILVDQWMLWQKKTGIKVSLYGMDWGTALQRMKAGEYDVIDTVFLNEERTKYLDFTKAYAEIEVPAFFQKNISGIVDADSLKGFNVAVKSGDNVQKILEEKGVDNLIEFGSYESIVKAAKNQEIVVFVMDKPSAMYYLYKFGIQDKFHSSDPLYTGELHRAVLKGNTKLLNTIENGFSLISKSEYNYIDRKWFGSNQINPELFSVLGIALLIVSIILVLMFIWSLTLDRNVKIKTGELSDALKKLKKSEEKYRTLLTNLNVGVAVFSPEGEILMHNQKFLEIVFGNSKPPTVTTIRSVYEFYLNDKGESIAKEDFPVNTVISTGKPVHGCTVGLKKADTGDIVWTSGDAEPEFDSTGKLTRIIYTIVDITERKKAEEALKESENRLEAFLRAIPDLFFLLDRNARFIDFYSGSISALYRLPIEFLGKSIRDIFDDDITNRVNQGIQKLFETGETQIVEYSLPIEKRKAYFEARLVLCGEDKILAVVRDVSQRKESEAKLYCMSTHDILTGLYNRNYFESELDKHANNEITGYAIIICDIDGLKLINDTLGHSAGDEYLKSAANIMCKCFRKEDIIARIGGDEFAVLMENTTTNEISSIKIKMEQLLNELNSEERVVPISISFGYDIADTDRKSLRELLRRADSMMYREKLHHRQSARSKNVGILTKMLEARDFITEGHGERMQELCCSLAENVGMSENDIKDMAIFAQFHDIGKVGIPDRILFKPGKLSEEEMNEMKRHTEIGYRIAEASPELMPISDLILKHHEWWDGNGYPFKLRGEEIPLQCRILSIVDAFDAMTSSRPYRNAISKEEAIEEIIRFKGKQFDPKLVDKFVVIIQGHSCT